MDGADGLAMAMLILAIASLSGAVGWWLGRRGAKRQFASRHFASVEADWSRKLDEARQDTETLVAQETSKVAKLQQDLATATLTATVTAAAQQAVLNSLMAQRDKDLAALRARIGELEAFPGKLADVERRLEEGAVNQSGTQSDAQSLMNSKDGEIASLLAQIRQYEPLTEQLQYAQEHFEQSRQQWAAAIHAKDQEIGGLWARIRELEPLAGHLKDWELHHHATIQAKDEEITSLIERLKDFERLSARLTELEPVLPDGEPGDDLKRIYGIGPVLEARLNALGLFRYEQIGRWGDDEIEAFQAQLPEYPGRIRREAWVKSARDEYLRKYRHPLG